MAVEIREKAVEVTLSLTSGAYQTSLVSYFTHRDLFPALMKVLHILSISNGISVRLQIDDVPDLESITSI